MTAPTCTAPDCKVAFGLSAGGFCFNHDPERRETAQAARSKGGSTTVARTTRIRVVAPAQTPGGKAPETLDDVIAWASWCAFAAATGLLDGVTVREINRSLGTLKVALEKKHLLDRIKVLEHKVRAYETQAVTR